jgi:hypothetical protein
MLNARIGPIRFVVWGLATAAMALATTAGVVNGTWAQAQTGEGDLAIPPSPPDTLASLLDVVPASSCLHAPARCGATRIVLVPSLEDAAGNVPYGPSAGDRSHSVARNHGIPARAAQAAYACFLKSDAPEIYIGADGTHWARGTGHNKCSPPVIHMETYVTLRDYISTGWRNLATASDTRNNGDVTLTARFNCLHTTVRAYDTQTAGYAQIGTTLYAGSDHAYVNHTCPT